MPDVVLAIDPAAKCGWAIGEDRPGSPHVLAWGSWTLRGKGAEHPGRQLERLRAHLFRTQREFGIDRIVYEEASYGSINGTTSARHSEKAGVILLFACELDLPVRSVHPTTLKNRVTGSGRAKKPQVIRAVRLLTNIDVGGDADAADAIGLLFCGNPVAGAG